MNYPVKWFSSHDAAGTAVAGAPALSGTAGSLIALIDACSAGYCAVTLSALTVSAGTATATVNTGHPYLDQQIIEISGAGAALDGQHRVTRVSATTFAWATAAADGTLSGAITAKVAGLGGWAKIYTAGNSAMYRSSSVLGRQFTYLIDDSAGTTAVLRGYRAATAIDAGASPFPGSDTVRIAKSSGGDVRWVVVADEHTIYVACGTSASISRMRLHMFGDLGRLALTDGYCSAVAGFGVASQDESFAVLHSARRLTDSVVTIGYPSGWSGESSIDAGAVVSDGVAVWTPGYGFGPPYPAPSGGALVIPLHAAHGGAPRGRCRGLYGLLHASGYPSAGLVDIGGVLAVLITGYVSDASSVKRAGALAIAISDWEAP
ncbi:hypothetical protein [Plasticicumulans acidivorans]|uniref:Uncharacterized protein n=1 Tax=Plasticicumulans acidivorans TaxID=886464 RepID=A0A317N0H4_9GAMM|nr:hypothetical protein [Plasticicumulans acidivorans]PWV65995.1 hypothetical protein C7443_101483 [Plasticicumulans acidivorans]